MRMAVIASVAGILCPLFAQSQNPNKTLTSPIADVYRVNMSQESRVTGAPSINVVIDPMHCDTDGSIYLEGYDLSKGHLRYLYRLTDDGSARMLRREPSDLADMQFRSFYPGTNKLLTLMQAKKKSLLSGNNSEAGYYLYISDKDGMDGITVSINDLNMTPVNAAILPSGNVLLFGLGTAHNDPMLLLLDPDGSMLREIDVKSQQYGSSQELQRIYGEKRTDLLRILGSAKFIPFQKKYCYYSRLLTSRSSNLEIQVSSMQ